MTLSRKSLSNEAIDAAVERVCKLGCAAVYRVLDEVDRGELPEVLADLDGELLYRVVIELRSIMAVYDAREGGAACKLDKA